MTESTNVPLDEVRGLVDERTRYEGWLEALEARRGATPAHVFDRVWQDYDGRRRRVGDALAAHVGPLRENAAALSGRHGALARDLAERRDGLAEIELRAMVGEYAPDEGDRLRQEADAAIAALDAEAGQVDAALADVRGLLERASAGLPTGEDAARADRVSADVTRAETAAAVDAAFASDGGERDVGGDVNGRAYAGGARAGHHVAPALGAASGGTPPRGTPSQGEQPRGNMAPTFAGQSLADAALNAGAGALGERASAGSAASPPDGSSQEKTLRCQDCGAMNYPTEWYCERCGGELAAL